MYSIWSVYEGEECSVTAVSFIIAICLTSGLVERYMEEQEEHYREEEQPVNGEVS